MIRVTGVAPGTIGEAIGLVPGTELLSVNGEELEDFLDWEFLTADEEFTLLFRQPASGPTPAGSTEFEVAIERALDRPVGVAVEPPRVRRCANRCDFCFVDGNPADVRPVLNIRDDDYRLSFRYGHFATLTNLKPHDTARIIRYRLSPLYVSVHATDCQIRRRVLRNPQADDILEQLASLAAAGIVFHTQIVLSPELNDGEVLQQTLEDLWQFGPSILSISVVPVGLTEFSRHRLVREPTAAECVRAIEQVDAAAARAMRERGVQWAYGADELYLRAGVELPPPEAYGSFDQVENGVGSVRWLQQQVRTGAASLTGWSGRRIGVVTGAAMTPLMPQVLAPLEAASGATVRVISIDNEYFGRTVTTAGLLPGEAIGAQIEQVTDCDVVLIPRESINDDGCFIDSLAFDAVAERASVPVRPSRTFVDALSEPLAS